MLTLRPGHNASEALPSGPLEVEHRTLEVGLRSWVERQTSQKLGYVEQLYTFGDRDRVEDARAGRALTVAYLALVREARPGAAAEAVWRSWYRYFPWEDWRDGRPAALAPLEARLAIWTSQAGGEAQRRLREERLGLAFARSWNEELALERYELLYEAGLIHERWRDFGRTMPAEDGPVFGEPMAADHRRILATAIGRLRGKIKYRPVVFELMPPSFTRHYQACGCTSRISGGWSSSRAWSRKPAGSAPRPAGGRHGLYAFAARCCWSVRRRGCGCAPHAV
jgi:hypothetical protein